MELSKKLTILITPELHEILTTQSQQSGRSIGELVRAACEREYGKAAIARRLAALDRLFHLDLPVSDVETMTKESIAEPKPLPGWRP
jgi:hypothetical protein